MIRILIADDHPLMREAIRAAIEDEVDLRVVAEVENGLEAVRVVDMVQPDVILMDLLMPVKDGLTAISEIISQNQDARILAFTSSQEDDKITTALSAGALGFLRKDAKRSELLTAIREISQGRPYLSPVIASRLIAGLRKKSPEAPIETPAENLTPREAEIVALIKQGLTNREISEGLMVGEGTIRTHVHNILRKLDLQNRNQIILREIKL
jgi:DNA-binding NarL/FixJ family response regulator